LKLLVFSDLHGDWTTGGAERFDEASRGLDQVQAYAAARGVERVLFLGDLCDPDVDPTLAHRTIARALGFALNLRGSGVDQDWLVGNHDYIDDGRGSHTMMALMKAGIRVHSQPANQIHRAGNDRVEFVWLPYGRYDPDRYVRELAASHRMGMKGGALVVCGHATRVPGTGVGSESTDMARGRDMPFPLEACRELAAAGGYDKVVLLNGHVHRRCVDGPVLVPGSMFRVTHGEEDHEPGFMVIEV
jgi:predicted phosphodiesterase